jgi:2-(1,2-epoxy-1,2-dihydrophenyl)acetyl-CoA isomerase
MISSGKMGKMVQKNHNETGQLLTTIEEGVLVLTINRPERRNALSPEIYIALHHALNDAIDNPAVGAIVLTGAGTAFSAGGDVARMAGATEEPLSFEQKIARLRTRTRISELLHTMDKPTIAMIRGPAVGAGLSLAMACDMRFADTSARLGTAFLNVGLSGDFGGHYFLPKLVGMAKARELYFTTPILDAAASLQIGLLNQVVEPEALEPLVLSIARKLANGPRTAIAYMKQNLNQALDATLPEMLDSESWRHIRCTETADHKEATQAYVEKRAPRFNS